MYVCPNHNILYYPFEKYPFDGLIIIYTQIDFRIHTGFEAIFCLFEYILYDFKDTTPKVWPWILAFFNVWKGIGYGSVMYLAAIMGIDTSLYEAAAIDGANVFQRIFKVTIPMIMPTTIILLLLSVGGIFKGNVTSFDLCLSESNTS